MTARTRYLFIASFLVLMVGVGTGLVAYYTGLPAGARHEGPDELQLIPPTAVVVAYANVGDVMGSDVHQKLQQMATPQHEERKREFEAATGINLEADIDRLVACLDPQDAGSAPSSGLVLARGRFNEVKIEALMREHGAEAETYRVKRLLTMAATPRRELTEKTAPVTLAFIEPGLAAIGNPQLVRAAIDLQQGGRNVTNNAEVMKMVRSLDGSSAWAVGRLDAVRSTAKLPAAVTDRLPAVTWFSLSGRVDTGLNGVIRAEARDEEAAKSLRDVVRGLVALARLQSTANPPLQAMAQSLELGGEGKTVALSFAVSGDALTTLGAARQLHAPQRGH